jgi:hypothetical protein
MSYCLFSSDNWKSNVYVYDAGYAKIIHVASRKRLIQPIPELPIRFVFPVLEYCGAKWNNNKQELEFESKFKKIVDMVAFWFISRINWFNAFTLNLIPLVNIELPHAGEVFECNTTDECIEKLEYLRKIGYNVPQSAIDALLRESADECIEKETNDNS